MKIVKGTREFEVCVRNVRYEDGSYVEVIVCENGERATGWLAKDRIQLRNDYRFNHLRHNNTILTAITITPNQHREIKAMVDAVKDKVLTKFEKNLLIEERFAPKE